MLWICTGLIYIHTWMCVCACVPSFIIKLELLHTRQNHPEIFSSSVADNSVYWQHILQKSTNPQLQELLPLQPQGLQSAASYSLMMKFQHHKGKSCLSRQPSNLGCSENWNSAIWIHRSLHSHFPSSQQTGDCSRFLFWVLKIGCRLDNFDHETYTRHELMITATDTVVWGRDMHHNVVQNNRLHAIVQGEKHPWQRNEFVCCLLHW